MSRQSLLFRNNPHTYFQSDSNIHDATKKVKVNLIANGKENLHQLLVYSFIFSISFRLVTTKKLAYILCFSEIPFGGHRLLRPPIRLLSFSPILMSHTPTVIKKHLKKMKKLQHPHVLFRCLVEFLNCSRHQRVDVHVQASVDFRPGLPTGRPCQ